MQVISIVWNNSELYIMEINIIIIIIFIYSPISNVHINSYI